MTNQDKFRFPEVKNGLSKMNFSPEFQNSFVALREKFEGIRGDVEALKKMLEEVKVPISRYDRDKIGGEDEYAVDQSFVTRATKYLAPFLKNFDESAANDPDVLIKTIVPVSLFAVSVTILSVVKPGGHFIKLLPQVVKTFSYTRFVPGVTFSLFVCRFNM